MRRWSLRRRLVVSSVTLVAVVCTVIGVVTALALHSYLYGQLDAQVRDVGMRAGGGGPDHGPLGFLANPGLSPGTVGAAVGPYGEVTGAAVSAEHTAGSGFQLPIDGLSPEQAAAFSDTPLDGVAHTVDIPGLGAYRVASVRTRDGRTVLVGLSTAGVRDTVNTLVLVEMCVTAAGLAAAGLAGTALIRISLQPLRRVAATAARVSELPLHRGAVALHERVGPADTDSQTEVGQVGAALNRMLGHVGSALHARQESETRVRRFVADASHELRTPLASIRGYAELTRRGREDIGPDTRHALRRIESEAARMTTLVEDLLLLARLDAGRPLEPGRPDLSPLVVDAVSDAQVVSPGHLWRLDLPDEPVIVLGDPARLHQVLANLLANARTHTPPGTTVTARVIRGGGGEAARAEIEDDGPGIAPELLPHVFERFARGDASRSRSAGSTGLGLAIVHAVVTAHGGEVEVESRPGRTVFTVRLLASETAADSQPELRVATWS